MEDYNPELESFRQEWRAEVSAKAHAERNKVPASRSTPSSHLENPSGSVATAEKCDGPEREHYTGSREPLSALEHYEQAVESESRGNLNESVNLYRKAFRMDDRVDQLYKSKHFPPSALAAKKPLEAGPFNSRAKSSAIPDNSILLTTIGKTRELILSFSERSIPQAPPEIEGTPPPPSPFSDLPAEILTSILLQTALLDIPSFVELSLVCKKLCYLVATEETIWKRICLGSEVGFGGMFYDWQCEITGKSISSDALDLGSLQIQDGEDISAPDGHDHIERAGVKTYSKAQYTQNPMTPSMITDYLLVHRYQTYHKMFRIRPRIRFNGVYISTITYHRTGQASVDLVTWNSPVHTVTYFRYLRFYRDGTCISLLTSAEPAEVVSMLSRANLEKYAGGKVESGRRDRRILVGGDGENSAIKNVMKNALKGRWHLSSIISPDSGIPYPETSSSSAPTPGEGDGNLPLAEVIENAEGDCIIETEGVDPKYIYRLELSLKETRARATRTNCRLNWKGYWLYNRETDDWGEFLLRNDKNFVFSRVRSYEEH